jgi:hypothetical protein
VVLWFSCKFVEKYVGRNRRHGRKGAWIIMICSFGDDILGRESRLLFIFSSDDTNRYSTILDRKLKLKVSDGLQETGTEVGLL